MDKIWKSSLEPCQTQRLHVAHNIEIALFDWLFINKASKNPVQIQ